MRAFLKKILLFCTILLATYISSYALLEIQLKNTIKNHSIILLGDSQTKFINHPEIYNYSVEGSPYFIHYEFAKKHINSLKNKKIYIAYNYHNLSKLYQNRLANDSLLPGWRENVFKTFNENRFFNHNDSDVKPVDIEYDFINLNKISELFKKVYSSKDEINTMESVINDTLSIASAINRHWNHSDYILNDTIQRKYLDKLTTLLKEANCEVILLKMPLTNYYINNVPESIKNELLLLPKKLNVDLLDLLSKLKISKQYKYFKDYGHLNKNGDVLITNFFKQNVLKENISN